MEMPDEIIGELWKVKDAIAEEYGCDVKALVAHLKKRKHGAGREPVDLKAMNLAAEQDAQADRKQDGGI
jgi:hypothetical protein